MYLGAWEPLAFDINRSFQLLFMVIIGGLGSILGCFLGAAFILVLPIMLDQVPHAMGIPMTVETVSHLVFIVTGGLICYLLIVEPHGFAKLWSIAKRNSGSGPIPTEASRSKGVARNEEGRARPSQERFLERQHQWNLRS